MTFRISFVEALERTGLWPWQSAALETGLSPARASDASSRPPILLEWRLTALQLNPKDIERHSPDVLAEMRKTCALCGEKRRCMDDMMECLNPPGWESYCPNSGTIRTFL